VLGISVTDVDDADARFYGLDHVGGALVRDVSKNSPAADAGLEPGDVIVGVADRDVTSVSDLQRTIRAYEPGTTVSIEYVTRDKERHTEKVELISADSSEEATAGEAVQPVSATANDPLGIEVENIDSEVRRSLDLPRGVRGVVITDLAVTGPFARRESRIGFPFQNLHDLRGLVITEVNRHEIESVDDYEDAMKDVKPGDVVGLTLFNPYQDPAQQSPLVPLTVPIPSH
jgi:serine protease Do